MASGKHIRDEIMRMTIAVNSDPAQKEIYKLNLEVKEYSETNKTLTQSLKEVNKQRVQEEKTISTYTSKIAALKDKLKENENAHNATIKTLKAQQSAYDVGSKEYLKIQGKIDSANVKAASSNEAMQTAITNLVNKEFDLINAHAATIAETEKLGAEIEANNVKISTNKNKITELTNSLDVNRLTMSQLRKEAELLKSQLDHLIPGTSEADELQRKLDEITTKIADTKKKTEELSTTLDINNMTMAELRKEAGLLKDELDNLVPGSDKAKELDKRLSDVKDRMSQTGREAIQLNNSLDVNTLTMGELRREAGLLKDKLENTIPTSDEAVTLQKRLDEVTTRMNQTSAESRDLSSALEVNQMTMGELRKEASLLKDDLDKVIPGTERAIELNNRLEEIRTRMSATTLASQQLTDRLKINSLTMAELRGQSSLLRDRLDRTVPGTPQFQELAERLQEVRERMDEVNESAEGTGSSFGSLAEKFNHYSGIIVAILGTLAGLTLSIQNIIDRNNKMADAMSAVEKTANMTKKEVEELTKAYAEFDTRTNKIDLLKISEVGGRLGVPKEQMAEFTKEVDKAYVALGDSWKGGVDKLADSMGRIATLYKETKNLPIAQSISEIGSALNELAASGASSEQNIADFVARLGSMPPAMKPALTTLLGFGSAFEESNINSEIASSGFAKFVRVASSNASGFAQIMNQPVAKVKELINSNPAEFFLQFSEGLKGLDATQVSAILDELKLSDNEVQRVIGAATENTNLFRDSVDLASESLQEATSLQAEFNKVNNNAAGIYEKVQKKLAETVTSQKVAEFINNSVTAFGKFIGVVEDTDGRVTDFRNTLFFLTKIIALIIATTVSYNLVTGVYNGLMRTALERVLALTIVEKARNVVTMLGTTLNTLYTMGLALMGAGYALVTGNVAQATFAMRGFTAAIAANPLGLLLVLVTTVASAMMLMSNETDNATKSQNSLNNIQAEATKNTIREKEELYAYLRVAKNDKLSKDEREAAIRRINKISPEYLGNLTLEKIKTNEAADAVRAYVRELDKKAMAEALFSKKVEVLKKRQDIEAKGIDQYMDWTNFGGATSFVENRMGTGNLKRSMTSQEAASIDQMVKVVDIEKELSKYVPIVQEAYRKRRDELRANYNEQKLITQKQIEFEKQNAKFVTNLGGDPKSTYNVPDPEGDKARKDAEKARKKEERERLAREKREQREAEQHEREMNRYKKFGEDAERVTRETEVGIQDAKVEAMQEGYEKEIAQIELQEQRRKLEIDKKRVGQTEFNILQKKIDSAKGDDKIFFEELKKSWTDNNAALEKYKEGQDAISANKRLAAKYKSERKFIASNDEAHQSSLESLKTEYNNEVAQYTTLSQMRTALRGRISSFELSQIRTFAEGKEALQRVYNKREIDLQVAHLQQMVEYFEGLNLTLLTDEQRKEVLKYIEDAGNKIAELKAKAAGQDQDVTDKKTSNLGKDTKVDILGLDQNQWIQMFDNLQTGTDMIGTMQGAVTALKSAFELYYKYVEANEQRQLKTYERNTDRKKNKLKQQLDAGIINQETYKRLTVQSDIDLEKKKAELAVKSAKRERAMQIANIIGNTALGIMKVWADPGYPMAIPLSVVVGALGAVQMATVLSTPLPTADGYESGFNTVGEEYPMIRQQDGKKFNVRRRRLSSGLVDRPTHFIAGENAVEMVIDNPTWTTYSPELKQAIYSANRRAKGFETGFNTQPNNEPISSGSDDMMIMLINALHKNNEIMEDIKTNGIQSYIVKSARNGKDINEMVEDSKRLDNNNKH
ncbi:phage tail tape measure protein [Chryseobacterium zhengzhouense]|uniref:Phage tail tape measure protein n=1 Tax=Chryseobacterium zhengzhouense TaxID=1636086 RepID=A0ABW2LWQ4_9FLAO